MKPASFLRWIGIVVFASMSATTAVSNQWPSIPGRTESAIEWTWWILNIVLRTAWIALVFAPALLLWLRRYRDFTTFFISAAIVVVWFICICATSSVFDWVEGRFALFNKPLPHSPIGVLVMLVFSFGCLWAMFGVPYHIGTRFQNWAYRLRDKHLPPLASETPAS